MYEWMDGYGWVGSWMDGWMNGWMNEWMDGWMDGKEPSIPSRLARNELFLNFLFSVQITCTWMDHCCCCCIMLTLGDREYDGSIGSKYNDA